MYFELYTPYQKIGKGVVMSRLCEEPKDVAKMKQSQPVLSCSFLSTDLASLYSHQDQ